jgi:hypothetical protein
MSTPLEQINHYLASRGLGQIGDKGLLAQFGFLVRDHLHLQSLLIACEPGLRGPMYEALAPNLTFRPWPLEKYLIEGALDAERRQLPIITPDGKLEGYKVPEVKSSEEHNAVDQGSGSPVTE